MTVTDSIDTSHGPLKVGDRVTYQPGVDPLHPPGGLHPALAKRLVRVTEVADDLKHGYPGFIGDLIDVMTTDDLVRTQALRDHRQVWGYASQVTSIVR